MNAPIPATSKRRFPALLLAALLAAAAAAVPVAGVFWPII